MNECLTYRMAAFNRSYCLISVRDLLTYASPLKVWFDLLLSLGREMILHSPLKLSSSLPYFSHFLFCFENMSQCSSMARVAKLYGCQLGFWGHFCNYYATRKMLYYQPICTQKFTQRLSLPNCPYFHFQHVYFFFTSHAIFMFSTFCFILFKSGFHFVFRKSLFLIYLIIQIINILNAQVYIYIYFTFISVPVLIFIQFLFTKIFIHLSKFPSNLSRTCSNHFIQLIILILTYKHSEIILLRFDLFCAFFQCAHAHMHTCLTLSFLIKLKIFKLNCLLKIFSSENFWVITVVY